jgi:hypothetical protein
MNGEVVADLGDVHRDGFAGGGRTNITNLSADSAITTIRRDSSGWPLRRRSARSTSIRVSIRMKPMAR